MNLATALALLPGLVIGLTLHEFAHAWSASLLGDNFPRRQGRVSLNPLRHLSPLGTLAIFLLPFGWGRPVVVNLHNFRRPKRDYLLTSLAGPLANAAVVAVCFVLMQWTRRTYAWGPGGSPFLGLAHPMLWCVAAINIVLAVLNLIPIPPLDGSKIWPCLVPGLKPGAKGKTTWVFLVLLVVLLYSGALNPVIAFASDRAMRLLPTSDRERYLGQLNSGREEFSARQYPQAEQSFTRSVEINPFSDECFYKRSLLRGYRQAWPEALEDATRAIDLNGDNPDYYECRASALAAMGRPADANADRQKAWALRVLAKPHPQPASDIAPPPARP